METTNLKINCLGASNTRIIVGDDGKKIKDMNYPIMLGLRLRCKTRNYGVSGTNIMPLPERCDSYFERASLMDPDCDLIILQGEGNDCTHNLPLGDKDDIEPTTYCGAVRALIRLLNERFPHAKLLVVSGMKKGNSPKRTDAFTHGDFHDAFLQVCAMEGYPPVNLYEDPLLDPTIRSSLPDGTHMSEAACAHYANLLTNIIRNL